MNKTWRGSKWYAGFLLLAGVVCLAGCPSPQPPGPAATLDELVSRHLQPLIDQRHIVGAAAGVLRGEQINHFAFGQVRWDSGVKPDADTLFEIGSITKTFTGVLMGLAEEQGLVQDNTPAQDLLPEGVTLPTFNGEPILLWHLATHSSGLPGLPDNHRPADADNPYADYTIEKLYAFVSSYTLPRAPGAQYEYSNLAAGLLGHELSLRMGKSYEELVTQEICGPLGMPDTVITLSSDQQARLAQGYRQFYGICQLRWPCPISNWDMPALPGAGALRSSVTDLLKYMAAHWAPSDTPLGKALQNAQRERFAADEQMKVGLLWHIIVPDDGSPRFLAHNGETGGYRSFVGFYPEQQVGLVILTNTAYDFESEASAILSGILELPPGA